MKKLGILTAALAVGALAGCMGGGKAKGGEAGAIENAKQQNIAYVSRSNVLIPEVSQNIGQKNDAWNNDYLFLTVNQVILDKESGKDYTVNIEWKWADSFNTYVKEKITPDDDHIAVYFNYSKTEEFDFEFEANFTCGSAKSDAPSKYKVHVLKNNLEFLNLSIKDIYKPTTDDKNFDLVDPTTGFYRANNAAFPYTCVETYGEVLYLAPDGDWALIGDGDYNLELFSGSARNLNSRQYPALVVGQTVKVMAELGSYYANCQVSFIFDISAAEASRVTKPTGYKTLEADYSTRHYWQCDGGLMNGLRTVSCSNPTNFQDRDKKATTIDKLANDRFTFEVTVGSTTLKVAYDYHVDIDKDGNHLGIFDAFVAKLKNGGNLTIKGTVRFEGKNEKDYLKSDTMTSWTIVPFLQDHIA